MWWIAAAMAGKVFVNEVLVDPVDLAAVELKNVRVTADREGNLFIDAPGYSVRPVDPNAAVTRATPPAPALPADPIGTPAPAPAPVAAAPGMVKPATWWLYAEDQGSAGHTVDVKVNGVVVTTIRSGQAAPVILDLQKWLRLGANQVECVASSTEPTGGPLYVYVGRGEDRGGTVNMGTPEIQFGVGSYRHGVTRREYTLEAH